MIRIYRPAKTATQSGLAHRDQWIVAYETPDTLHNEAVMGWTASTDTRSQVTLPFSSLDSAIAYARAKGEDYTVYTPTTRQVIPKNYEENFTNPRIRNR